MTTLRDKTILITGASSGLGAALALELAGRGARLGLFSFDKERQQEVAERCRERGGQAIAIIGDVTRLDDCRQLVTQSVAAFGGVDHLVANAGISMWARFEDSADPGMFRRLMEVNYMGAVNCVFAALPELKKRQGSIVAITSIQARIGVPLHTGYVASKAALQGFCDSLRTEMELDQTGVSVLTVLPHWIRGTELRQHALSGGGDELGQGARKHREKSGAITVDEAARAIVQAMATRQRELYMPRKLRLLATLHVLAPRLASSIIKRAVRREDG